MPAVGRISAEHSLNLAEFWLMALDLHCVSSVSWYVRMKVPCARHSTVELLEDNFSENFIIHQSNFYSPPNWNVSYWKTWVCSAERAVNELQVVCTPTDVPLPLSSRCILKIVKLVRAIFKSISTKNLRESLYSTENFFATSSRQSVNVS